MKLVHILLSATLSATPIAASEWTRDEADGVVTASLNLGDLDYIEALCDVGISIPITSISLMIHGNSPEPGDKVEFRFGQQSRVVAYADPEGVIASLTAEDAEAFDRLLDAMRTKQEMVIRLNSGIRQTFTLEGSEAALEGCEADANKLELPEAS